MSGGSCNDGPGVVTVASSPPPCFLQTPTVISVHHHRALRLLTAAPHGRTVADMLAHGITNATLNSLVRDGLAALQPGTVRTGTRRITVVWVAITDVGREVLVGE